MSFLDRLHKIVVQGGWGALHAAGGLAKDLATAAFTDDEYDGIVGSLYHYTVNRAGQGFGAAFGPDTGLGALIGGMPEGSPLRAGGRNTLGPVLRQSENVYHGISTGLSTALYAGSVATGDRGFVQSVAGIPDLFRPATWQEAYRMASENADPGQALALGLLTRDINNPVQVTEAMNSDAYEVMSGTSDAVFRFFLDPLVLAGHTISGVRKGAFVQPLDSPAAVARIAESEGLRKFNTALEGQTASEIRDRWFSAKEYRTSGSVISSVLADATNASERYWTLRSLMGDQQALTHLSARRADIGSAIDRLTHPPLTQVLDSATLQAELKLLYPEFTRVSRVEAATASIVRAPRVTEGAISSTISRSDFWQASPLAKPIRVVTEMMPRRMIPLHDASGDIQIKRFLDRSNLTIERQDALRDAYMRSSTPADRQLVATQVEHEVIGTIATQAGMTPSDIQILLDTANKGRQETRAVLQSRTYDAKGRSLVRVTADDGTVTEIHMPIWATQEKNFHVLPDIEEITDATTKIGQWKLLHPGTSVPGELLDSFYRVWKPSVLLRFGWPLRVVGDEQLRILAQIGALSQAKALARTVPEEARVAVSNASRWAKSKMRISVGPPREAVVQRGLTVNGYTMEGAFGAPGDMANVYRDLASSNASFRALVGPTQDAELGALRTATGQARTFSPWEADYGKAWEWAVTNQLAQDSMARIFLKGGSVDDAVKWLTEDPKGIEYAARNPVRSKNVTKWARVGHAQVQDYLPHPELRQLALKRTVTAGDLTRLIPDANLRPLVHGEILMQNMGKGFVTQTLNRITSAATELLGRLPSDVLSRNPYFDHVYRAEASRLVNVLDDGNLTETALRGIERRAREYALDSTKALLYDLAEQSRLQAMLRHMVPFYGAWQEVITRWSGLAVENPAFIARMRQVWQAPEKMGLLTDEHGREVEWGKDYGLDEFGVPERGKERYLTIPLPEWARDIPGLRTQGEVAFNRKSFNLALQGAPGFGPPVQIAVNEVVKNRPDLEESLKLALPFGATQDELDLVMPSTARRLWSKLKGEEDRAFFNIEMRIYWDKVVDYNLGKRNDKPTWDEAHKEANSLYSIRVLGNFGSPVSPSFRSPYQLYIDAYRQARERYAKDENAFGGSTPDEWFYETYGSEYFPLTQSLSKSVDGVPPTLEGYTARGKHKDLIEAHPELGGLIVGAEGAGKFSGAVYDAQFANKVGPGSADEQRVKPSFEEASTAPDIRQGWLEYSRVADLIDAEMVQRGLPSLSVKGASDLRALRQSFVVALAKKFPDWYDDYQMTDQGKWRKRIEGMEAIVSDKRLSQRAEFQGLGQYLQARKLIVTELTGRKNKTLTAQSNTDLADLWSALTAKLVEQNLAFGALFHRWLENDPVEPTLAEKSKVAA